MTPEQETVLMIKGAIAELSPENKKSVTNILIAFDELAKQHGDDCFVLALALIGAKLSAGLEG
jgi:hypothetical protein